MSCPANAVVYNDSQCSCSPGHYLVNRTTCVLFDGGGGKNWEVSSGIGGETTPAFLTTVIPLDSIRRLSQLGAVLLETTLAALLAWLLFCLAVRCLHKFDSRRRSFWFKVRWGISRLDVFYATRHWLEDGEVVRKRRTELGGTFSIASWIVFIGLLSALLYQIISKRSIEVHRVRPTNAIDLVPFVNDMEFNITTISSMTCSHLRGLDNFVTGTPGFIDYRISLLSKYINHICYNTSNGPLISLKCNGCRIPPRNHYVSWQFVDLPNDPATAVGFQFNLTARDHNERKHVSYVSGTLISDFYGNDRPKTFRGPDLNVLKIQLVPQAYSHLNNLKLIQPLFHDFIPGSYITEASNLQLSLQNPNDGFINMTLSITYLSDFIMEVNNENVIGPGMLKSELHCECWWSFAISFAIFLYLLVQFEARIKKLNREDIVMREALCRMRAQKNWDKLRKYVMYTWGADLVGNTTSSKRYGRGILHGLGSLHKKKRPSTEDFPFFDENITVPDAAVAKVRENQNSQPKGVSKESTSLPQLHLDKDNFRDNSEITDST